MNNSALAMILALGTALAACGGEEGFGAHALEQQISQPTLSCGLNTNVTLLSPGPAGIVANGWDHTSEATFTPNGALESVASTVTGSFQTVADALTTALDASTASDRAATAINFRIINRASRPVCPPQCANLTITSATLKANAQHGTSRLGRREAGATSVTAKEVSANIVCDH